MKYVLLLIMFTSAICFGQTKLKKSEILDKFDKYILVESVVQQVRTDRSFLGDEKSTYGRVYYKANCYFGATEALLDKDGEETEKDTTYYFKIYFDIDESIFPQVSKIGRSGYVSIKSRRYIRNGNGDRIDCNIFGLVFSYSCWSGKIEDLEFQFDHVNPQIPVDWKIVNNKMVIIDN